MTLGRLIKRKQINEICEDKDDMQDKVTLLLIVKRSYQSLNLKYLIYFFKLLKST